MHASLNEPEPLGGPFALSLAVTNDFEAGVNEEHPEADEDPEELADERRTDRDEDSPQGKGAKDPPEQHPVLKLERDGDCLLYTSDAADDSVYV